MISAKQAIDRLREGNARFAAGVAVAGAGATPARRAELAARQHPFAVVVGCSDSRVPVEMVFDQGLGDLFVVRVAGNVVGPLEMGSVELAVARLGARLVVVLGHEQCGAIKAALEEVVRPAGNVPKGLRSVINEVRPVVEEFLASDPGCDAETLVSRAVRAHIRAATQRLRHGSELLGQMTRQDGLVVIGAEYSLATGVVEFFDRD